MAKSTNVPANSRLGIGLRVLAAGVGGYFLTMALCLWLQRLPVLDGNDGRRLVNMIFFLIYAAVVIWVFAVRRHATAVTGVSGLGAALWLGWFAWGAEA
ncbi:hypothetical protein NCG89_14770 [Spongiibacter taiwanensis]|uniref:hypothetical protein n=1 Tax=Spongiibacter taiwanensis TaxID=1748242 RepID=UPI002035D5F8|nr:hypothetical protein [Spongiibacter taiwanensis]USA42794.1 hypothetical protein NCG89_14770 [Spongiibacter taiwanensis]